MTRGPLTAWLAGHPRARRAAVAMTVVYTLSLMALTCAPNAVAAGGSAALGWSGLRDTEGVPLSYYFLSMVSVREAATNNGQEVSVLDPSTWLPWLAAATERAVDNATASWWLTMFAGTFIFIMAVALWFLRFALSTGWLAAIATVGLPLYHAVGSLIGSMMLGPIAITVCVIAAGYHVVRGNSGRGWAMIGTAIVFSVLLATVFSDPVGDLYSEHGLLALGRGTGLEVAQAATGAPFASGASLDAKLDTLMSNIVTASVRHPLQVLNFGMVVDDLGGCRQAWSSAITAAGGVEGAGPARAMTNCGAPQALAYAQRLGGGDATVALALLAVAVVVAFFYFYVGLSVMVVGIKALYFGILVGPSFLVGMVGFGRAHAFAKHCGVELFMHVIQLAVFEVYLAVSAIGITWVLTTDLLGSATATAIPRLLIMAVAAAALWMAFRIVDRSFHTDGMGTIGRQARTAWHAGTGAASKEAKPYRDTAQSVRGRLAGRGTENTEASTADGAASTRRLPGVEWFAPRSTAATGPRAGTQSTSGTAGGSTAARSAARSAATKAAIATAKVVAPEVAVPAAAAGKAASGVQHAGRLPAAAKTPSNATAPRPPVRSTDEQRTRTPHTDTASGALAPSSPRQVDAGARPARGNASPAGMIDTDEPRRRDDPRPRPAPPRPPREIGS